MGQHVAIILPHPDDEAFGCSGTILEFREKDIPVTYFCGTLGEMGRNMGSPFFANRETLPEIRKEELQDACKELDINLEMLGYRDKTLEFEDRTEVAKDLKQRLEEINPSLVITFYPGHAVHPDHDAMGAAAIKAVEMMDESKRPEVWAKAITHNRRELLGEPDIVRDVEDYFEGKMRAIEAHRSQAEGMMKQFRDSPNLKEINSEGRKLLKYEEFYKWTF
ncbi:bacillithiol biosynthesis deacetylase BshB2 [Pontibacillus salipaludis]|uniref:N-acetyl-alpha-D-glucosaminyl L-malate deacetylase 2 n=1 Tax=Pontibacillus salipaludis TaxID=1697394 RepID=A0ABQ1QJJ2_9BACI|nr:bacillithiol biosynthesis deacetylase BshB2 [Pontibacillus salipaludis]GGD28779.1 putative N-acetyl-alpha-D-glucosaminyl L-malate deacetylase 2 [Pontibacillus salipaludis]